MDESEIRRQLAEARVSRERVFGELSTLRAREQAEGPSDGVSERVANLNRSVAAADDRILELEGSLGRQYELERMAATAPREAISPPDPHEGERRDANETRDQALRTIERHADAMESGAAVRLDGLVRSDNRRDWTARYLAAAARTRTGRRSRS